MNCMRCGGVLRRVSGLVLCQKCGHVAGSQNLRDEESSWGGYVRPKPRMDDARPPPSEPRGKRSELDFKRTPPRRMKPERCGGCGRDIGWIPTDATNVTCFACDSRPRSRSV